MRHIQNPKYRIIIGIVSVIFILPLGMIISGGSAAGKISDAGIAKQYNVLLVVLDACRPDHLGCYGYQKPTSPNIDKLASESVLFEQAYAQGIQTLPSFGSFLTGKYPSELNLYWTNPPHRILHPEELTLTEILRIHNYRTAAFPTGPHLLPLFGLSQGFQIYSNTPDFGLTQMEGVDFLHQRVMMRRTPFSTPEGKREVWSFQDTLQPVIKYLRVASIKQNTPFFLLVHSNDTHPPYDNPMEFAHKFDQDYDGIFCKEFRLTLNVLNNIQGDKLSLKGLGYGWDYVRGQPYPPDTELTLSERDLNHIRAHYDGAIAYADHGVGKILETLSQTGFDRDTIVILLADHGETIGERELFDRSFGKPLPLYNEVIRVPLIIRHPDVKKPSRIPEPVQLVDLMPTLLDLTGIKTPNDLDGISLKSAITGDKYPVSERPVITEATPDELAFRAGDWKLIYRTNGLAELYNLKNDPGEKTNLVNRPEAQSTYKEILDNMRRWQNKQLSRRGAWAKESDEDLWRKIYPR